MSIYSSFPNPKLCLKKPVLSSRLIGFIIFFSAIILYGLGPSRNYHYADDSMRWAFGIASAENYLINSHHLFLNVLRVIQSAVGVEPMHFLAFYSALLGALGLVWLYYLLCLTQCRRLALYGVLICAFSAGYWSYSIAGDVYVPAASLIIGGLYAVVKGITTDNFRSAWHYALLSIFLFILAIMHHQAFFFIVLGLFPAVLLMRRTSFRKILIFGIMTPLLVGLLTTCIYAVAYYTLPENDTLTFLDFTKGYVTDFLAYPDMKNIIGFKNIINGFAGGSRAFISYNFLFKSSQFAHYIQNKFPYRHVYTQVYLVKNTSFGVALISGICAGVVLVLGSILTCLGIFVAFRKRRTLFLVVLTVIPQAVFFLWWEPISDEFWIWLLPILALSITTGARLLKKKAKLVLSILISCLLIGTFSTSILVFLDASNDIDQVNKQYISMLTEKDLLIGFDEVVSNNRIKLDQQSQGFKYFNLFVKMSKGHRIDLQNLNKEIDLALNRGGKVFVDPYLINSPTSYFELIKINNPYFKEDYSRVLTLLEGVNSDRVIWLPLRERVNGFFKK